ncbi:MAG: alpha/beta hydrolase [Eggerthellaceae bacterium]|nr:alpha/beta hydrolase [Eggerthellaceae bacterium]
MMKRPSRARELTVQIPADKDAGMPEGAKVTVATFGYGKRPMVIVPGLSLRAVKGAALPLSLSYRRFTLSHTVYVIDRPDPLPDPCTVENLGHALAAAMRKLGIADADVLGVSQGGMISQCLAINDPDLIHRLVLAVTACEPTPEMHEAIGAWIGFAETGSTNMLIRDSFARVYSDAYVRRYRWALPLASKLVGLIPLERFIALAKACLTMGTSDRLSRIMAPVLVIGGAKDKVVGPAASPLLAAKLGCDSYIYENLGHSVYDEARDFNERVLAFFTALDPSPAAEEGAQNA